MLGSIRRLIYVGLVIAAVMAIGGYFARESLETLIVTTFIYDSRGEWELVKLREQVAKQEMDDSAALRKCMSIARENPGSRVQVAAYAYLANEWPDTAEAKAALVELRQAIQTTSIDDLDASCLFRFGRRGAVRASRQFPTNAHCWSDSAIPTSRLWASTQMMISMKLGWPSSSMVSRGRRYV